MIDFRSESIDRLFEAVLLLKDKEDCYTFFEDLCTITELQDMAQRLDAADLLLAGMNYQNISKTLGISTATISRVSRCLNYGTGGYKDLLERVSGKRKEDENV